MMLIKLKFNPKMEKAVVAGQKTRTRRIVKPQPVGKMVSPCPYNPGDVFNVKSRQYVITKIRTGRLRDITDEDAKDLEGCHNRLWFAEFWDWSCNYKWTDYEWQANPWVWVIDFVMNQRSFFNGGNNGKIKD